MELKPYADNVLVLFDHLRDKRVERRTAGGLFIPATSQPGIHDAVMATVVAAGPGWYDEKIIHNEGMPGVKMPAPSQKFCPMDPAIVPGARVLVDHAISGDPYIVDGI